MDLYNTIYNLLIFSPIIIFVHFRGIDFLKDVYSNVQSKVERFKELKTLANKNNISLKELIKNVTYTIYSVIYYVIIQKLNKSVKRLDKHNYEITYSIGGKIYKFITAHKRGMGSILQIIDQDENDVTEKIEPFFGPHENFHHIKYKPSSFGCETLTFNYCNGNTKLFEEDEVLLI